MKTTPKRRVEIEGCNNFRDLGGYPTSDGRRVRWRVLFRADATDLQRWDGGFHRDQMHLGLLASADKPDRSRILTRQMLGRDRSHRADPYIRTERALHEGNRKSAFNLR